MLSSEPLRRVCAEPKREWRISRAAPAPKPTVQGDCACSRAVTASVPATATHASMSRRFMGRSLRESESPRSEEHTSELQSRLHLVCRLLLEKKKKKRAIYRRPR